MRQQQRPSMLFLLALVPLLLITLTSILPPELSAILLPVGIAAVLTIAIYFGFTAWNRRRSRFTPLGRRDEAVVQYVTTGPTEESTAGLGGLGEIGRVEATARLTLRDPATGETYNVTTNLYISPVELGRLQPGARVPVFVDTKDRTVVTIDTDTLRR